MRATTTTVAVIGADRADAFHGLVGIANNVGVELAPENAAHDQLAASWERARARSSVYTLIDFDPIQETVDRWISSLDTGEPILPTPGDVVVPDYYLVTPAVEEPRLSWYFQLLFDLAPQRVRAVEATVDQLYRRLASLPYGAGLPSKRKLEEAARHFVPTPGLQAALASTL